MDAEGFADADDEADALEAGCCLSADADVAALGVADVEARLP